MIDRKIIKKLREDGVITVKNKGSYYKVIGIEDTKVILIDEFKNELLINEEEFILKYELTNRENYKYFE